MNLTDIREPLDITGSGKDVGVDGAIGGGKTMVLTPLRVRTATDPAL
jgi:hypothetical protein